MSALDAGRAAAAGSPRSGVRSPCTRISGGGAGGQVQVGRARLEHAVQQLGEGDLPGVTGRLRRGAHVGAGCGSALVQSDAGLWHGLGGRGLDVSTGGLGMRACGLGSGGSRLAVCGAAWLGVGRPAGRRRPAGSARIRLARRPWRSHWARRTPHWARRTPHWARRTPHWARRTHRPPRRALRAPRRRRHTAAPSSRARRLCPRCSSQVRRTRGGPAVGAGHACSGSRRQRTATA